MVDRKLTGAHYGLKDWLVQRITAIIMLVFTILLLAVIICLPSDYLAWREFFNNIFVKVIAQITALAVAIHAWVGVRDIWMDYIKPASLRLTMHCLTFIWLVGVVIYSVKVIFGAHS